MRNIVILGAGGMGKEAAFLIEEINRAGGAWRILGLLDANASRRGVVLGRYPILGGDEYLDAAPGGLSVAAAIGDPDRLRSIALRYAARPNLCFPNLLHPSVVMDRERVRLQAGNLICAGCVLTSHIQLGSFNILNRCSTIGHDVRLGDGNLIHPGAVVSGGVVIGDGCVVGANATVLQYRILGSGCRVGAGAVVTRDVPEGITVVGQPARPVPATPEGAEAVETSTHPVGEVSE